MAFAAWKRAAYANVPHFHKTPTNMPQLINAKVMTTSTGKRVVLSYTSELSTSVQEVSDFSSEAVKRVEDLRVQYPDEAEFLKNLPKLGFPTPDGIEKVQMSLGGNYFRFKTDANGDFVKDQGKYVFATDSQNKPIVYTATRVTVMYMTVFGPGYTECYKQDSNGNYLCNKVTGELLIFPAKKYFAGWSPQERLQQVTRFYSPVTAESSDDTNANNTDVSSAFGNNETPAQSGQPPVNTVNAAG